MSFRVLHPGTFSLLVDHGRPSHRSLGIPLGGAADRAALMIGNGLVGNETDAVALEMTLSGPTLRAKADVCACVFGAAFAIAVADRAVDSGRLFTVRAGEVLRIGGASGGARGYLCVRGGFRANPILESRSAFSPIHDGESLECDSWADEGLSLSHPDAVSLFEEALPPDTLRVIGGPQASWFPKTKLDALAFRVSPASNRMGVRLEGTALPKPSKEMVSEAVAPGAIQVTNEGLPIILGVDGQTIGGYPKIAHVIDADLDRVGQLRPGQQVRFKKVSLEDAETLAMQRRRKLQEWRTRLRLALHHG